MNDLVSRSYLLAECDRQHQGPPGGARKIIEEAPSIEPEIIFCKDCKRHNVDIGDFRKENGKRHWYWKDEACPLVGYRGKAQGHEFDYQFCVYAERRTDDGLNQPTGCD